MVRAATQRALIDELVRRYEAGATVKDLAAERSMHHRTVKKHLESAGVVIRVREPKLTAKDIDQAVQLYRGGQSTQQVGDRLGVSHNTVRRHLGHRGVQMRPNGRPPRDEG